jgi:hypothetical protein
VAEQADVRIRHALIAYNHISVIDALFVAMPVVDRGRVVHFFALRRDFERPVLGEVRFLPGAPCVMSRDIDDRSTTSWIRRSTKRFKELAAVTRTCLIEWLRRERAEPAEVVVVGPTTSTGRGRRSGRPAVNSGVRLRNPREVDERSILHSRDERSGNHRPRILVEKPSDIDPFDPRPLGARGTPSREERAQLRTG